MATIHGIEFKKVTFHDIYPDDRFSLSFDIDQYFAVAGALQPELIHAIAQQII